jgi:hypothetical protein
VAEAERGSIRIYIYHNQTLLEWLPQCLQGYSRVREERTSDTALLSGTTSSHNKGLKGQCGKRTARKGDVRARHTKHHARSWQSEEVIVSWSYYCLTLSTHSKGSKRVHDNARKHILE